MSDSSTTVGVGEFVEMRGGTLTPAKGPPVPITGEPLVVGRAPECGLVLDDPKASSTHFEVVASRHGVRLRDLSSRNGTFLDGTRCIEVYLTSPVTLRVGDTRLAFAPRDVKVETGVADSFGSMVGSSRPMRELFHRIQRIAATNLTALIQGETGTGKELIAKAIHDASARRSKPFVVVDCSAIPSTLAESMLFGHEKGSFTDAKDRRVSPFVEADGGTVFLDEIGELPTDLQPKLLRVVQEKKIKAIGATSYRAVDVRIIAATRRELQAEINSGRFRSDLYFRLAQAKVAVPALRERADDIHALVDHFARREGLVEASRRITPESLVRLMEHDWPGNVRELENIVVSTLALADPTGAIEFPGFGVAARGGAVSLSSRPIGLAFADFEKHYYTELAASCGGRISEMARVSGKSRPTVRAALAKYGIERGASAEEDRDEEA